MNKSLVAFLALQVLHLLLASQCFGKEIKEADLSPFARAVFKRGRDSGNIKKLLDLTLTPEEARKVFYEAGKIQLKLVGAPVSESMLQDLAQAMGELYALDVSHLDFMKLLSDAVESYMAKKGLDTNNVEGFADKYHNIIVDIMKSSEPINSAKDALLVLVKATDRMLKSSSQNLAEDIRDMFNVFTNATKNLIKYKSE